MDSSSQNDKNKLSRRGFFPLLGSGLLLPILGFSKPTSEILDTDEEYDIFINAEGKSVKVRKSVVKKASIVNDNVSNQSLLDWLKNKF